MTREEAAKILKEHRERKFKHTFYTLNEYQAATDMAIKALEQQPCEDCVSRQAVLDINFKRIIFATTKPVEMIEQKVKALPSIAPQQKTGRWLKVSMDKYIQHATYYYECSECGNQHIGQANYCPNCGAKMREVEE